LRSRKTLTAYAARALIRRPAQRPPREIWINKPQPAPGTTVATGDAQRSISGAADGVNGASTPYRLPKLPHRRKVVGAFRCFVRFAGQEARSPRLRRKDGLEAQ
jgi:hypothetical protein